MAAGSAGMAQAPSESSGQNSVLLGFSGTAQGGTLIHIQTTGGDDVLTFAPAKDYQTLVFSCPELAQGSTYDVYLGGSAAGAVSDGLYQAGSYTPGTEYTSFTVSGAVTWLGGRQK